MMCWMLLRLVSAGRVNWVLDADIQGFFDAMSHDWILRFLKHRIADKRILRLIAKWLKAGIVEDGHIRRNDRGTPRRVAHASGMMSGDFTNPGEHLV